MNKRQRAEKTGVREKIYHPDDVLDLEEIAAKFDLDPRTIGPVASELGGKRFGRIWKFQCPRYEKIGTMRGWPG